MPNGIFLTLAVLTGSLAWQLFRRQQRSARTAAGRPRPSPQARPRADLGGRATGRPDRPRVGYRLIRWWTAARRDTAEPHQGRPQEAVAELGFLIPSVHIRTTWISAPTPTGSRSTACRSPRRTSIPTATWRSTPAGCSARCRAHPRRIRRSTRGGLDRRRAARSRPGTRLHRRDASTVIATTSASAAAPRSGAARPRRGPAAAQHARQDRAEARRGLCPRPCR